MRAKICSAALLAFARIHSRWDHGQNPSSLWATASSSVTGTQGHWVSQWHGKETALHRAVLSSVHTSCPLLYHLARRLPPGIEVLAKSRHLNCSSGSSDPYEDYLCFYFYQGNTCKWFKKPNRSPGLYKKWHPLPHPSSSPIPTPRRQPLPTLAALWPLVCTPAALCNMFTLQSLILPF